MDNRANILSQSLQLFAARGYDAVGVQEICESAGITKPTLYHYFGSKIGLLKELLQTQQGPLNRAVAEVSDYQGDLPGTLLRLARVFFDFAQANPVYYRMMLALNFAPQDSEARQAIASLNEAQYHSVGSLFEKAEHDHGNMRGRHALYAATFIGVTNTCIGLWLNGYLELDNALLERVVRQFQYGIYS